MNDWLKHITIEQAIGGEHYVLYDDGTNRVRLTIFGAWHQDDMRIYWRTKEQAYAALSVAPCPVVHQDRITKLEAVATVARTVTELHPQATQTHDVHLAEAIIKLRQALAVMESR